MDTQLTVVRHGQTAENLAGILQGWLDAPLDVCGRRQACAVAARLADEHFDHLFTSDLQRTFETAQIIGEHLGLAPRLLPNLREWHLGELEGRQCHELEQSFPKVMRSFLMEPAEDVTVPGGESHSVFCARIALCLETLAAEYPGKRLLLVTHGGVLRAVFRHVVGLVAPDRLIPQTTNAGISRFCNRNGRWQMTCWNDCSHLLGIGFRDSVAY